ncbi:MAG: alpha/beta hydrolase [Opitutaceae bacterium]|nr:alpha/beta hydrolase [Opitutaceae bacterium]
MDRKAANPRAGWRLASSGPRRRLATLAFALVLGAALAGGPPPPARVPPTRADVPYGPEPRQVLDFWSAATTGPAPVVIYLHPGGWIRGDKAEVSHVERYLAAGISVVAINYRFVWEARAAGVRPPVRWPLHDAARALQFVRLQAAAWRLDPDRIGATGDSAGAFAGLWLALHRDLAEPDSPDPVARQSTRLACVAVSGAQTTLDPLLMKQWMPNSFYGGHAFGIVRTDAFNDMGDPDAFLARREEILPWIEEYSPYSLVSASAPPVYLYYRAAPALGQVQDDPTHSANFGVKLQEKLRAAGVECELVYPGAPGVRHPQPVDFLIARLAPPPRG